MSSFSQAVPSVDLAQRVEELERANAELARSNHELAEFAAVASHEMRAPLQTLLGYADLLADQAGGYLDPDAASHLADIRRGADRLRVLVEALLGYAQVGAGVRRRETVGCDLILEDCIDALLPQIDQAGAVVTGEPLPEVVGDPDELVLVFRNLLSNALKSGRQDRALRIEVKARRVGQCWQFTVADNGTGIDPLQRQRIFRVFQRGPGPPGTSSQGSGIGLAIVRRIVEGHGGRIWATDGIDGGAALVFTVAAPVCWSPFG